MQTWQPNRPAVVMDCGTGFSKIGFAGNSEPSFVLPTVIGPGATAASASASSASFPGRGMGLADLDFTIGEEALAAAAVATAPGTGAGMGPGGGGGPGGGPGGGLVFPVRGGVVTDWDAMERFWQRSLFHYLRVDPEEHPLLVTEPPLNPPEAREALAEVAFETLGAPALAVGVSAVLALYAGWATGGGQAAGAAPSGAPPLTGVVVDVGEGATSIIPVADGYVLGGAVRQLPVAGRAVTGLVQGLLRERGEPVPPELSAEVARRVKEGHCYCAPDMLREFGRYDREPARYHRRLTLHNPRAGADYTIELGYERFLGPEALFSPGLCPAAPPGTPSLPRAVDDVIQACPIDTRRALYGNVVLSGGSTMFKNFGRRLAAEMTAATSRRLQPGSTAIDIAVRSHAMQRYAVWFGGSVLACDPAFPGLCRTRAEYEEHGPSICRTNHVFRDV